MLKRITGIILVIVLLILFTCTITAQSNASEPINIIDEFEYKIGDCPTDENGMPTWISSEDEVWHNFINTEDITENINNETIVWFRVKIPVIVNNNTGIYMEKFFANSLTIYLDYNKVYEKNRTWIYNQNSFVLPLPESAINKYLYIKSSYTDINIGPNNNVLIGNYSRLLNEFITQDFFNIFVGFGLIFIAIALFICSFILKDKTKKTGISLSFILISIGYIILVTNTNIFMFFPRFELLLSILYDMAMLSALPLLTYFFKIAIISEKNKYIHLLWLFQLSYSVLCSMLIILNFTMDYKFNSLYIVATTTIISIILIIQLILLVSIGIQFAYKGHNNAKVFITGFSILALLLIIDLLIYYLINSQYSYFLWKWGIISFSISLIVIFVRQYTISHKQLHVYSNKLKELEQLARTDFLTNLPNRMDLTDKIGIAIKKHEFVNKNFIIALCDIDNFKTFNDSYGHNFGDEILIKISEVLRDIMGDNNSVGRWGGEEFLLLLNMSDVKEAYELLEQARLAINTYNFYIRDKIINVTVTFGMCQYNSICGLNGCLNNADIALYHGKKDVKNTVVIYEELIIKNPELIHAN